MTASASTNDKPVAVLVDCDNVPPEIVEHALLMGAQFGRVVIRRGYGNSGTLAHKWQDVLVRQAFTPCLQYQYASGKNTADIALALDALEALFDRRAETFCLVTSDSDFAYLCRKLRERGASVCIVGEPKTPLALRNACDEFFEWTRPDTEEAIQQPLPIGKLNEPAPAVLDAIKPLPKRRPLFVVNAVALLAASTSDGKVSVAALGSYLKRANPAFTPNEYGHSGLNNMIKTYELLALKQEAGGHWSVSLAPKAEASEAAP